MRRLNKDIRGGSNRKAKANATATGSRALHTLPPMPPAPKRLLSHALFIAVALAACRKEPAKPQWDVDLVLPLARTTLTLSNLVADSLLDTDATGNVSILYTAELFSLNLDTILTAPDTSFQYAYALPFSGPFHFPPGASFGSSADATRFNLQDLALSKLIIRSGMVDLAITNMMNGNIIGDFSLPGATINNEVLAMQVHMPPGTPASPSHVTRSKALDGYTFDLTGPTHNSANTLSTELNYSNAPDGESVTVTDQDSLLATVSYRDIVPEYATGYFGSRDLQLDPDTTTLGLFQNITGTLNLAEVNAQLRLVNGIGVDARAHIHQVRSLNTRTGQGVDLIAPITGHAVNINRAVDLGHGPGEMASSYAMHAGNSNIKVFLENLPDRIAYDLDVSINPLGNVSSGHDFFYHGSKLSAELEVDIPLRLIATNLTLRKVMKVDLAGSAEHHALKSGVLHLYIDNGFPFSAAITLEVVDGEDETRTMLLEEGMVPSAVLGGDGLVASSSSVLLDVSIDPAQMALLHQTGRLRVTAAFNTIDQHEHVWIMENYRMDVQATMEANYLVNGDQ